MLHYRLIGIGAVAALFALPIGAPASLVVVSNGPTQARLRICSGGGTINRVDFTTTAANIATGVPITGTFAGTCGGGTCPAGVVFIDAEVRAAPPNTRTATLSANSSVPMNDGLGNTISFTEISWAASGFAPVTIPSGTFSGGAGQVLATWNNSRRNRQCHTFSYANTNIYTAGNYDGRVTYTLTMP